MLRAFPLQAVVSCPMCICLGFFKTSPVVLTHIKVGDHALQKEQGASRSCWTVKPEEIFSR